MMPRPRENIRVLVADDSPLVRDMLSEILDSDPDVTVIGHALDGEEAVSKTLSLKPDLVTMDIDMPVLGGLEAIERIMELRPTPILTITSLSGVRTAFAAVSKGALDVLEKSDIDQDDGGNLIQKVKSLARIDVVALRTAMGRPPSGSPLTSQTRGANPSDKGIIVIAASTGGPQALRKILGRLPASLAAPVVIGQHVADGFTSGLSEWLNRDTALEVTVAKQGDRIRPGRVYLNPSEWNMRVAPEGLILLRPPDPGQLYHPSCDILLRSVAGSYGESALGLILTGMGDDGVEGLRAIKAAGGATLAQDEATSVVFGMNGIAVQKGVVDLVLALSDIPSAILRMVRKTQEAAAP